LKDEKEKLKKDLTVEKFKLMRKIISNEKKVRVDLNLVSSYFIIYFIAIKSYQNLLMITIGIILLNCIRMHKTFDYISI